MQFSYGNGKIEGHFDFDKEKEKFIYQNFFSLSILNNFFLVKIINQKLDL